MRRISPGFIYFFGALGGFLFGYDTGVISGALLFIQKDLGVNSWQEGWITSAVLIGAVLGAALIGPLSDRLGRKRLLLLAALIFFVGALGSAFALNPGMLIGFRIVLGIAVGAASALVPTYLAELSPAERRGGVTTMFQLMVTAGIFIAYICNFALQGVTGNWHWMLGLATVPAALLFLGGFFLPESPRYLLKGGREQEARQVLQVLYAESVKVEEEVVSIKAVAHEEQSGGWAELFGTMARPALIMAVGLAVLQQFIGVNTVIYFAPSTFVSVGFGSSAALLASLGIGLVNFLVTILAMRVMDRVNRRTMLTIGSVGMLVTLILMAIGMMLSGSLGFARYLTVIAMMVYIVSFSATWGPVMWVMIGESFPLNIRGLGNSFGAVVNWAANFVVTLTFLPLLHALGTGTVFIIYAVFAVLSLWFVHSLVIETRGRSLEEIEEDLHARVTDKAAKI